MSENNPEIKPDSTVSQQPQKESGQELPKKETSAISEMTKALKVADLNASKVLDEKMSGREGLADPNTRTAILLDPDVLAAVKHTRVVYQAYDIVNDYNLNKQKDGYFKLHETDTGFEGETEGETLTEQKARTVRNLTKRLNKIALEVSRNIGDTSAVEGIDQIDAINFAIKTLSPQEDNNNTGKPEDTGQ